MTAIDIRQLSRTFRPSRKSPEVYALNLVDLRIPRGEVHGLLGPNGAGKTTLCKILSTVLLPTSGVASVLGHDVVTQTPTVKRMIGVVFGGDRGLYGRLTARQNLRFWAALYGLRGERLTGRVNLLLDRVGLAHRADERVDKLSRGMKQRLHLARGIVGDPPVLILDEPTVGMDPVAATDFRALVGELRADGRTILLTTHDMAEAAAICDRVSLIDHGGILTTDSPDAVSALVSPYERVEAGSVPVEVRKRIDDLAGVTRITAESDANCCWETTGMDATTAVIAALIANGVTGIRTGRPDLRAVYLHVFGDRGMTV